MSKKIITEEMKVHEDWYKEAHEVTLDNLSEFVKKLCEEYQHDYGTICHAVAAAGIAAMSAVNNSDTGGITGFQSSMALWGVIRNWMYRDNKTGLKILNMDDILFPQYEDKFTSINYETFQKVIETAKENLEKETHVAPRVKEHWLKLAAGIPPFGLKICD